MKRLRLLFCALFSCLPLAYLALIWDSLPAIVPIHFDAEGNANGFSSKESLWMINGGLAALTFALYLLFSNLHRIDPKRSGTEQAASFVRVGDGMVLFLTTLNFITLLSTNGHELAMIRMVYPLIGLLFAFMGNVMFSIKPNYFAGIRVPWTLADDDNWRATHRVAGVVWFIGGVLLVIGSLAIPLRHTLTLMFALLGPMVAIPIAYSFWYFRHSTRHRN